MNKDKIKQNAERTLIYLRNLGCDNEDILNIIKELKSEKKDYTLGYVFSRDLK